MLRNPLLKAGALSRTICLQGKRLIRRLLSRPAVVEYAEAMLYFLDHATVEPHSYPCVMPNWITRPGPGTERSSCTTRLRSYFALICGRFWALWPAGISRIASYL